MSDADRFHSISQILEHKHFTVLSLNLTMVHCLKILVLITIEYTVNVWIGLVRIVVTYHNTTLYMCFEIQVQNRPGHFFFG